jgi:hypothetical protein
MRRTVSLVLGTLLVLVLALPVSAASVERTPLVFDFGFVDFTCGFTTLGEVTISKEVQTDFYDNDGNLVKSIITGRFVVTFTNLSDPDNGKSIVENISSSGHFDYVKNTFFIPGRSSIFAQIYTGRLDLADFSFKGHISDEVCQALA